MSIIFKCQLKNIRKTFKETVAVDSVNFDIYNGELIAILGPSGCGKSTLLQLIAGLEKPNKGEIIINDKVVYSDSSGIFVPANKRKVGLVFQNYALWPHYNVFDNIAYPLKIEKKKKEYIKEHVEEVIKIVKLQGMKDRYPNMLSGGEQQRVALARALIMKPEVLLLDEPLSHLDAKLSEEMQKEIKSINEKTGITMIYVTHNQKEAMQIADRIAVMNEGNIIQYGKPKNIYENPKNEFVAGFIGETNLIKSKVIISKGNELLYLTDKIHMDNTLNPIDDKGREVILSIRPEDIILNDKSGIAQGEIIKSTYKGNVIDYLFRLDEENILQVQTSSREEFKIGEKLWFDVQYYKIVN
jgi:iron(III) transport system ATP-binding protein